MKKEKNQPKFNEYAFVVTPTNLLKAIEDFKELAYETQFQINFIMRLLEENYG